MQSDRDLLKQALEALEIYGANSPDVDQTIDAIRERLVQPEQDYREALRVLSLALEEAPGRLTPKQRSVWEKSRDVLCSAGGGWA